MANLLIIAILAQIAGAAAPAPVALRVMSFNVRNSNATDGVNAWVHRKEFFFEPIEKFAPDLVGFQEVLADQYDLIGERMKGYAFCGGARDDGKRKGEWSCVGYRTERFTEVKHGDFWLSETPTVAGSKSWDAALTRLCSWVRLREKATGKEIVFANTHFDHKGVVARQEASRVLSKELSAIAQGVPAILIGDLNINEDNPAYAVLVRPTTPGAVRWIDSYRTVHPMRKPDEASFNGFKGTVVGSRIDFVFHTDHFKATEAEVVRWAKDGMYPSDHYPVTAVLVPAGK
ncbi:MAG: endonuclease/exonuclease/phosphatase family protein [Verrucomicrobiota bacterium]